MGCATVALAINVQSLAQTTLPPVRVEAKTPRKKAKAPRKAAPTVVEPPAETKTAESGDKARSEAVYKTLAGVSVANKSDIETFGMVDAGDVLRGMPGVSTRDTQGAGLAINIRGFEGSGRVNMMIDGVRQSFKFTSHEAQGLSFVDPALLAGIDVTRGAVSTVGGAGALAGAANMRTLDVEDIIRSGYKTGVLSLVTFGTNGVGWQEMLGAAGQTDKVGIAAAVSHREPDNYRNGNGVAVPFTHQDPASGLVKLNIKLTPEQTLKLGVVLYDNDFFANSYYQNVRSDTYTLKYTYKPTGNPLIDFSFNAHMNQVHMEYFHDATPLTGVPPLGTAAGRVIDDRGKGFDLANTSRFAIGPVKVTAIYGYEYFADDFASFNKLNAGAGGGVNPSGESSIAGLFWQTKFSIGIFDLITALRYDTFSIFGTFTAQPGNPLGLPVGLYNLDKSDGRLDPKITLSAQVMSWLQTYVTYSESFRPPTIFETMLGGTHPGGGAAFSPNPFLEPEVQRGREVGANIRLDKVFTRRDAFRFRAAYFDMNVENYITGCFIDPSRPFFCNATGTSQVEGVELEAKYDAGFYFAGLSYTYNHTTLPSQADGLGAHSFLPEHTAVLTAGLRLLEEKLTVGARVSYFSESFVGFGNFGPGTFYGSPYMPGYTLVDVFSTYKVSDSLQLSLTVKNVFDLEYTPALATPFFDPVGNCFGSNIVGCNGTGPGRTILLTAKMQF